MSEKKKKKKDETWTEQELSAALHKEKRSKKDKHKDKDDLGAATSGTLGKKSSQIYGSHKPSDDSEKRKSKHKHKSRLDEEHVENIDERPDSEAKPKHKKKKDKDRDRDMQGNIEAGASRHVVDDSSEEEARRLEKERKRREKKERKSKLEESEDVLVEKEAKKEKRERKSKLDMKEEQEDMEKRHKKEKKERKSRHDRHEEQEVEGEHKKAKKDKRNRSEEHEDVDIEKEKRRQEKEEKKRRKEEKKREQEQMIESLEHSRDNERPKKRSSRHSAVGERKTSEKDLRRRDKEHREKRKTSEHPIAEETQSSTTDKESRHREHRDKKHHDKKSHQKASDRSGKSKKHTEIVISTSDSETTIGKKAGEKTYNYTDDDFEEYKSAEDKSKDEEELSSEVHDIVSAMKRENLRVASARSASARSQRSDLSERSASPQLGITSINFSAAKKTTAGGRIAKQILKRRNELFHLIQLDEIAFDLFELAPVTEYNFYIKSFGNQNTRQISTQCNDDALEVETQTDQPDPVEKWTQHPQDGAFACGGAHEDSSNSSHIEALLAVMQEGSHRFSNFLEYAGNLVDAAFAEEDALSGKEKKEGSILSCCQSCTKFNTKLAYLQNRQIKNVVFGDGGLIAVAFNLPTHKPESRLDSKGLVTVWKATNPEQPDKILVVDTLPVACCFISKKMTLLVVGTEEGTVLVYDLSESPNLHMSRKIEKDKISVLRNPTYTTGFQNKVHLNPIVYLNPVGTFLNTNQVFSMDEAGIICIWTAVDTFSDLEDDLGLAPQGHVKLIRSTPIETRGGRIGSTGQVLGIRATCAICPDATVFYVGMESGFITSLTRERRLKTYRMSNWSSVTDISISKLNLMLMLASYKDGTVALFQIKQESPLMTWSLGNSILYCDWSNCRSSVFFALASTNHLHVWDLMAVDSGPVVSDVFQNKIRCLCVDGHTKEATDLMVAYDSCSFELHRLSSHFTDSVTSDETEQMMTQLMSFA